MEAMKLLGTLSTFIQGVVFLLAREMLLQRKATLRNIPGLPFRCILQVHVHACLRALKMLGLGLLVQCVMKTQTEKNT